MASIIASLNCLSRKEEAAAASEPGAFGNPCFFSRGGAWEVALDFHAQNRAQLRARLQRLRRVALSGCVLVRGGAARERNDTDHEELFRQESYFQYLFGVKEPGFWGLIDLRSGEATLFAPRLPAEYAVWMGHIETAAELGARYGVPVKFVDDLAKLPAATKFYILRGVNSDSGVDIADALPIRPALEALGVDVAKCDLDDSPLLFDALAECRVHKSKDELDLLRYVSWVSSKAHVEVMRTTKPGDYEYQLEARFLAFCADRHGCRNCAYTSICACGPNSAVLHYGHAGAPNDRRLAATDMALVDMGAEYHCYCADITCSFPVRGTFTADQRLVYDAVLDAQKCVIAAMKPGVKWSDCHEIAERTILDHLQSPALGVLSADFTVDDFLQENLGAVFLPCGLGHFIGLDTHDVGGYLASHPPRATRDGLKRLRTARHLEEGMVLTVEPGLYFIKALLGPATAAEATKKFFNATRLADFENFGGVRLEDVVAVTADGVENYTLCPRTVEEVEGVMSGDTWPPVDKSQ